MSGSAQQTLHIGMLAFYVNYYESICEGIREEKLAIARECRQQLAHHGRVSGGEELICDEPTAERFAEEFCRTTVDVVVVVMTMAVFSSLAMAALRKLEVPVVIWNAQAIDCVGEIYDMPRIVRNTSQIGTQALANVMLREGREFRVVSGYYLDPGVALQLQREISVPRCAKALRSARLLRVGGFFPQMTDVELDANYLRERLGAELIEIDTETLTTTYLAIDLPAIEARRARLVERWDIQNLDDDELARSIRLSLALEALVERHAAVGGAFNSHGANCLRNEEIGITAGLAFAEQNLAGRPFSDTGDLPTALAMLILKLLGGTSMYTELQVHDALREAIVLINTGEGEPAMCRVGTRPTLCGNRAYRGLHGRGAAMTFAVQDGPATLLSLTPTPAGPRGFRLIVAEGTVLEETLPPTGGQSAWFRFAGDSTHNAFRRWLQAGPVHHAATALGHHADAVSQVAESLEMECIRI